MKKNIKIYEMPLLYLTVLLILFGTIMQYSASSTMAINKFGWDSYNFYLSNHIIRLIIGLIAMITMYNFQFKLLKKYSKHILYISWIILLSAYIFNNGVTRRYLIINGHNIFTTSDFARFALIIFTAQFISSNKKNINNLKNIFSNYLIFVIITLGLILFQPDLSSTFIISIILVSMLIVGGLRIKYIVNLAAIGITILSLAIIIHPYQRIRLLNWYNNANSDPTSQVERAKQALHNGGFIGNGVGESIIKEGFMAEVHTDFILPIIGEELGFLGILILFVLFSAFYILSIRIAKRAPDIFSCMLTVGVAYTIIYYFIINSAYVVGIIPPTGLAIPFISYGGSHTLFTLLGVGVLLNISKYCNLYKNNYLK